MRFILWLIGILMISTIAGLVWLRYDINVKSAGPRLVRELKNYVTLHKFRKQFSTESIVHTCLTTPLGRRYEDCYLPKLKAFEREHQLGSSGVFLKALTGATILQDDRQAVRNDPDAELRLDFMALGLVLGSLQELRKYPASDSLDTNARALTVQQLAELYHSVRSRIASRFERRPANSATHQIANTLSKYDQSYKSLLK